MAQWIQSGIPDSALHQYDFVNIMTYSTLSDAQNDMAYYTGLNVPANQIVLGVKFFGDVEDSQDDEPEYSDILNHYPNAWQSDSVSGDSSYYGGDKVDYTGEATMAKETQLGAQYGGIMIWELTGDAPAPHSLLTIVQNNL
jgi:chitinase